VLVCLKQIKSASKVCQEKLLLLNLSTRRGGGCTGPGKEANVKHRRSQSGREAQAGQAAGVPQQACAEQQSQHEEQKQEASVLFIWPQPRKAG
jgi:hypothetical protein